MKRIVFMAAIISAVLASDMSIAQVRMQKVNQRQHNQQERIHQGVVSGELTKGEARHLKTQQRIIQHDKRMAKADGRVTPREHRILAMEQNHANRSIANLKHNNRHR